MNSLVGIPLDSDTVSLSSLTSWSFAVNLRSADASSTFSDWFIWSLWQEKTKINMTLFYRNHFPKTHRLLDFLSIFVAVFLLVGDSPIFNWENSDTVDALVVRITFTGDVITMRCGVPCFSTTSQRTGVASGDLKSLASCSDSTASALATWAVFWRGVIGWVPSPFGGSLYDRPVSLVLTLLFDWWFGWLSSGSQSARLLSKFWTHSVDFNWGEK